jgi:predicted GNAT superfamily acetyltransferase
VSGFTLRPATVADHAAVLALNNTQVPHVNALTADEFARIVSLSGHFTVAEDPQGLLGSVLCIPSGTEYWSANYQWFGERYARFLYLDRVAVSPRLRRAGVGRALYDDLHRVQAGVWPCVTLEVNVRPPNPTSIAFHHALGYEAVGIREYADGENAVQMFIKDLGTDRR